MVSRLFERNKEHQKGWDKVPSLSMFWIVEQDAVVEWVYYADFIALQPYSTVRRSGDDEIEFNELPISVPLSFSSILQ